MAFKVFLMQEISKKMYYQGHCRMIREMNMNISKFREQVSIFKTNEYRYLNECFDNIMNNYDPRECGQCFEVADIQFAFNNRKLIKLLIKRGDCIGK